MKATIVTILICLASAHEFHLSLTEINHNTENKTLEISIKLFTDDLTSALIQAGAPTNLELGTEAEPPAANELVAAYLQRHFLIKVNGKDQSFKYLGKEPEMDATWCFLEIYSVKTVNELEVVNSCLLEAFDDQTNMVNLNVNGRKKSGLARKGKANLKFEF
jgi:hypothetical protein